MAMAPRKVGLRASKRFARSEESSVSVTRILLNLVSAQIENFDDLGKQAAGIQADEAIDELAEPTLDNKNADRAYKEEPKELDNAVEAEKTLKSSGETQDEEEEETKQLDNATEEHEQQEVLDNATVEEQEVGEELANENSGETQEQEEVKEEEVVLNNPAEMDVIMEKEPVSVSYEEALKSLDVAIRYATENDPPSVFSMMASKKALEIGNKLKQFES